MPRDCRKMIVEKGAISTKCIVEDKRIKYKLMYDPFT